MAAIYLDNLFKPTLSNKEQPLSKQADFKLPTYTDLHLDISIQQTNGNGIRSVPLNDIKVDQDTQAIRNSIYNILTTRSGEKILNPEFSSNLEKFLFEKIDDINAKLIGLEIQNQLNKWEPRINLKKILVEVNQEEHTYFITVTYEIVNSGLLDNLQMEVNTQSNNFTPFNFSYQKIIKYI